VLPQETRWSRVGASFQPVGASFQLAHVFDKMESCRHKRHDGVVWVQVFNLWVRVFNLHMSSTRWNLVATRDTMKSCGCEFSTCGCEFSTCTCLRQDGILSPQETRFHRVATRNHDTMKSCHPAGIDCSLCRGPFARDVSARRSWLKAPRTPRVMHQERRSSFSPPLVDEVGHQRRPARLVACPQAGGRVAVEVFVEEQLVTPLRVVAEAGCIAPHGPVA